MNVFPSALVFFGTPLNAKNTAQLKSAIRGCATAELQMDTGKKDRVNSEMLKDIEDSFEELRKKNLQILSFYETEPCKYRARALFRVAEKQKVIVNGEIAKFENSRVTPVKRNHHSVAALNRQSFETLLAFVDKFLSSLPEKGYPWLLIFDNAADRQVITKYWPRGSAQGRILLTTRDPVFAGRDFAGAGLELREFDEDAAVGMLLSHLDEDLRRPNDEAEARVVVQHLGCLPLGIQACIGLMNGNRSPLRFYSEQWGHVRSVLEEASQNDVSTPYASYEKALDMTFLEALDGLDSNSREMIELFSLLDPDKIQEEIFSRETVKVRLGNPGYVKDRVKCIGKLLKGLIGRNEMMADDEFRSFNMHRVLKVCTQLHMSSSSSQESFKSATVALSEVISNGWELDWPKIRTQYTNYFPHVQSIHDFYNEIEAGADVDEFNVPLSFIELLRKGAWLCYKRSLFGLGIPLLDTGERILTSQGGHSRLIGDGNATIIETVQLYYARACIETEVGNFSSSLKYFKLGLHWFDEGTRRGITGIPTRLQTEECLYGGIANSLNGLGRQTEAEQVYYKCISLKQPNDTDPVYDVNLNRCLWSQGSSRYDEAAKNLLGIIEQREKDFGQPEDTEDYVPGHAFYVLGNIRVGQGLLDEAYELHLKTVRNWEVTFGTAHHKTADAYHKIGWHLSRMGEDEKARDYLQAALDIYQSGSDQGFRKGEIARTMYKKGCVLRLLGELGTAQNVLQKAKSLRKELIGMDDDRMNDESAFDELVSLWAR
ncbi:hypothetical protein N7509_000210 [Penicillium cosmopolitanum]|uniref:DUF7779 domain-containing protein n=1 Tax=Penicillium cosmopolitanum TaxID=1131564 RepID=A0A9W9WCF0_9EURO|nr:uncharacterized protein N7509_000210 [Penicillium cosmopolitanum]KAJ5414876.1 hypothetical protein N7509_000210 [Penicillium cosmopolitanum]